MSSVHSIESPNSSKMRTTSPISTIRPYSQNIHGLETEIQRLERAISELRSEISRADSKPSPPRSRHSRLSTSEHSGEINFMKIPTFTFDFNLQRRQEWLLKLQHLFEREPRKLHNDKRKIIGALSYLQPACRYRWYGHVEEKPEKERQDAEESWDYFAKWTTTLLRNAATHQVDVMCQWDRAHQRLGQDPREFDIYLETLEQHLPKEAEKWKALYFFAKLLPELRRYIQERNIELPETRDEMVTVTAHCWGLMRSSRKRKRNSYSSEDKYSWKSRKTSCQ